MKLSAPTKPVWVIAVILGIIGFLGHFGVVPEAAGYAFYLMAIAFVMLAVATLLRGL